MVTGEYGAKGYAYVTYLHTVMRNTYLINQIYVLPKFRGTGIAKELLRQITEHADWEGAVLILDFRPEEFGSDAERLMKLYQSFGFTWDVKLGGMKREPAV